MQNLSLPLRGNDDQVQMAQILQANLAEIGITLEVKVMPWLSMVKRILHQIPPGNVSA